MGIHIAFFDKKQVDFSKKLHNKKATLLIFQKMTANTSKILHTHVHIKNIHLSKYIKWPKEKLPMPKFI